MNGKVGELKLVDIEVRKDNKVLYTGIGSNVPEELKVEFKQVNTINRKIVYTI